MVTTERRSYTPDPVPSALRPETDWLPSDWLIHRGWCQGELGKKGGPRCLYGASDSAFGPMWQVAGKFEDAVEAIIGTVDIPAWQDALGRTKEEVVAVARQAEIMAGLR